MDKLIEEMVNYSNIEELSPEQCIFLVKSFLEHESFIDACKEMNISTTQSECYRSQLHSILGGFIIYDRI